MLKFTGGAPGSVTGVNPAEQAATSSAKTSIFHKREVKEKQKAERKEDTQRRVMRDEVFFKHYTTTKTHLGLVEKKNSIFLFSKIIIHFIHTPHLLSATCSSKELNCWRNPGFGRITERRDAKNSIDSLRVMFREAISHAATTVALLETPNDETSTPEMLT